jgi:hypothetical protein
VYRWVGAARVLAEVYEDAVEEGISWVELCTSFSVKNGVVQAPVVEEWQSRLRQWAQLEQQYRGACSVRFVVGCPTTAEDAATMLEFLERTDGGREAVVSPITSSHYDEAHHMAYAVQLTPSFDAGRCGAVGARAARGPAEGGLRSVA